MYDAMDADGEWSDEEVVKSGSNTGVSETEGEDHHPTVTINRPQSSLGIMTSRSTFAFMTSDPLGHTDDPVTNILDRIDAEIEMIGKTPSLPSPHEKNGKHRNGSSLKSKSAYKNGSSMLHTADMTDHSDTGLGSISVAGDEGLNPDKINGAAEVYSEACMTDGQTDDDGFKRVSDAPSDLDSVAAQQIDTKFKEIMRKKKDDPEEETTHRHRPRRRRSQGDQCRVQFVTPPVQFRDKSSSSLPPDLPVHPGKSTASLSLTPRLRHNRTRPSATMLSTGYGTDNESIRTEDFESKFQNMLVTSDAEKQPDVSTTTTTPKQGILSSSTKRKEKPEPNDADLQTFSKLPSESVTPSNPKPEDDDILKRLINIANGPSPSTNYASSTNYAPSPNNARSTSPVLQGSSLPRPRSLSPSRLSLRKHHTSGDLTGLWHSSGSNSSVKTNWDDSFWARSRANKHNSSSRWSPSVSNSTFDEVESLNLSSRSSNDSHQFSRDRSPTGVYRKGGGGGGGGGFAGRDSSGGLYAGTSGGGGGGGGEESIGSGGFRGIGSYGDLHKRYLSRQSSTTSTSTSPSSGNFGSSEASASAPRDMALSKALVEFLEAFSTQGNIGQADRVHLHKLSRQIAEWDLKNSAGDHNNTSPGAASRRNAEPNSESDRAAFYNGGRVGDGKDREELVDCSVSKLSHSENSGKTNIAQNKRRKDLIIPDEEDNATPAEVSKRNSKEIESKKLKEHVGFMPMKSVRRGDSKENVMHGPYNVNTLRGSNVQSMEQHSHSGRNVLVPSMSFNKSGSIDSNASPPDPYNPFVRPFSTGHAERVLMGLGFGGKEGFLPERFLRDWYHKLTATQAKEYQKSWEADAKIKEKENIHEKHNNNISKEVLHSQRDKKQSESHYIPSRAMRQDSFSSSQLDEAANLPPRSNGQDAKTRQISDFLSDLSTNTNAEGGTREMRMKNWANSRQKSLPLCLETLSEEDEKNSRVPGVDIFDKEAKLQMFITDVMSNSDKSNASNSENSIISSNMSEYETQSSSSDGQNLSFLRNPDILKTSPEKYQERQNYLSNQIKQSSNIVQNLEKLSNNSKTPLSPKFPKSSPKLPKSPKSQKGAKLARREKKTTSIENKNSPNEKEVHFSTDSLEVADIMRVDNERSLSKHNEDKSCNETGPTQSRNPMLVNVEPAMVSIVLEDVDEGKGDSPNKHEFSRSESGRLSVPSSGSLSLSPIPQSPVTVIEVGLDNTHDSLDTEDGLNSSRENDNYSPHGGLRSAGSPAIVPCSNCGNAVAIERKRYYSNYNENNSNYNTGDEHNVSNRRNEDDRNSFSQNTGNCKTNLDVSYLASTSSWGNSSDESSFEGARRMKENKSMRNRSPNSFSRKRSPYSANLSPCQSPSYHKQVKEQIQHLCPKHNHSKSSPRRKSLSPSPESFTSENMQRRNWINQTYTQSNARYDLHCHNQCNHHYHPDLNLCEYQHSDYHYHHHPCQCSHECCLHHHPSPHHSSKYDSEFLSSDYQRNPPSISVHSSPGSFRSAFTSPRKGNTSFTSIVDDPTERSETDVEEFPTSVVVNLNPRPISVNADSMFSHPCFLNEGADNNGNDSVDQKSAPVTFLEDTFFPESVYSTTTKGKVQQISRAVQAYLPHIDNKTTRTSSDAYEQYYLVCDREVQCSLGQNDRVNNVSCFSKSVQAQVPFYEVSCQTVEEDLTKDKNHLQNHNLHALPIKEHTSKSVNTVICLIGDEHNVSVHDALISDKTSDSSRTQGLEFRLVDDTLDLIEMELDAINNKTKTNDKLNHDSIDSSFRIPSSCTSETSSLLSKPNHTNTNVNQHTNPFVSNVIEQSSQIHTYSRSNTNPFLDDTNMETDTHSTFTHEVFEAGPQTSLPAPTFDVEKEMSAFLKPCQGMYDGISTPDSFKSISPFYKPNAFFQEELTSPQVIPPVRGTNNRDTESTNQKDPVENTSSNSTFSEKIKSNDKYNSCNYNKVKIKSGKLDFEAKTPAKSPSPEIKIPFMKESMPPAILVKEFQHNFLQVPSSPHEGLGKACFPEYLLSSPSSSKSAPASTTTLSLDVNQSVPIRWYSFDDVKSACQAKLNVPTSLRKMDSLDINSEQSELPLSSSRDSLTEVSILSSYENPAHELSLQSLQVNNSTDSTHVDEVSLESLHLPVGIEFSLSCPHSNWDGMYGHSKIRPSQTDKLLRTYTNESDIFKSLYGMDDLSDTSIAGSETAQDIDEMDVMLSQREPLEIHSDSSYSDFGNDSEDGRSDTSNGSLKEEEVGRIGKSLLVVSDDQYDLLQISDCGEMTPSQSRMSPNVMSPTAISPSSINGESKNACLQPIECLNKMKFTYSINAKDNECAINFTPEHTNKHLEVNERDDNTDTTIKVLVNDKQKNEEQDIADFIVQHQKHLMIDPLRIGSASPPDPSIINLDSVDYTSVLNETIADENPHEIPVYQSTGNEDQENGSRSPDKRLFTMKSDPVDKTYAWLSTLSSPSEVSDGADCDSNNDNLLRTFQKAEFDSLLNKPIPEGTNLVCLQPDNKSLCHNKQSADKISAFEIPNAHILSIETDDDSENTGNNMYCSIEDGNIMDELEIIALFQNMENMNDPDSFDLVPKNPSPYPLSEIPEEDTQSEESWNIENSAVNGNARVVTAQRTQESIIENNCFDGQVGKMQQYFKNDTDSSFEEDVNSAINNFLSSDKENDVGAKDKHTRDDAHTHLENKEAEVSNSSTIFGIGISENGLASPISIQSDHSENREAFQFSPNKIKSTIEKRVCQEERTFCSGLTYICKSNSESSHKTILSINSPTKSNQNTVINRPPKDDDGHMSTISLSVGDYRNVKASTKDTSLKTSDKSSINNNPKSKASPKNLVKTVYSQSVNDDHPNLFISTKTHNVPPNEIQQSNNNDRATSRVPPGKRLRSRESLLRLHEQKKYTGSDSDSERMTSPQQNQEDDVSETLDSDSEKPDSSAIEIKGTERNDFHDSPVKDALPNGNINIFTVDQISLTSSQNSSFTQQLPLSITRGVIFSSKEREEIKDTKLNPRVFVQQPSEDVPFWDSMTWKNTASSSSNAESNDHHLHTTKNSDDVLKIDEQDSQSPQNRSLRGLPKPSLLTRRSNRSNLLSPNLALLNETFKEPAPPFRKDYSSSTDDSHPELSYLDLIPKFNGKKEKEKQLENRLPLPTQRIGVENTSNQTKQIPVPKLKVNDETKNYVNSNQLLNVNSDDISAHDLDKRHTSMVQRLGRIHSQNDTFLTQTDDDLHSETNKPGQKRNDNATKSENNVIYTKNDIAKPKDLSLSCIVKDQVENTTDGNNTVGLQLISPDMPLTSDSVDSSDSKFVSVVSRDSGFESRGSPIERPQRKNVLLLSGVEFSDENI